MSDAQPEQPQGRRPMVETADAGLPAGPPPRMDSPAACSEALLWGFAAAFARQARSITCVSDRFEAWPLDNPRLLQALTQWLRLPLRRLVLLAGDFGRMGVAHPRFEQWRRDWVHAVPAWRCPAEWEQPLADALFDDSTISVRVLDAETGRGRASDQRRDRLLLAQQTDVVLQRSEPAWPSKHLGL
jgi:hypothetical protein